jgi:outer membrane protein assembly factor BamA
MSRSVLTGTLTQAGVAAKVFALAALLFLWASSGYAEQDSAQFNVNINLKNNGNPPNAGGVCRSSTRIGTFGEAVTVECSTGKAVTFAGDTSKLPWSAMQDGYYRFVTQLSGTGIPLESDKFAGAGTVTSWRIVNLADWEYLELMVGW